MGTPESQYSDITSSEIPPGVVDDSASIESIDGSEGPFLDDLPVGVNPEELKAAFHETFVEIKDVLDSEGLTPEKKQERVLLTAVNVFYQHFNDGEISHVTLNREDAVKYLELAKALANVGESTNPHELPFDYLDEELTRLTKMFQSMTPLTPLRALTTQGVRFIHAPMVKRVELALRMWVLDHSANHDKMPSHYDKLHAQFIN
jgi:hypothetical protein